ncbi:MAG: hypothetical protein ACD_2C00135G0003 [uncultured bacterium (gcode 4)]|uniref:SLC26A/SulP transporter domain-containing protein n=1 Tax=uncultured bacterium (gcode 4) TaxID=1234023 RepID=K2G5U6_9BACT|nr:MAG: hypothetical protein ACD_2C00135G0003 [uncultured bacterium (gcode 4)]
MLSNIRTNLKNNWKAWLSVSMINIPLSISLAVASGASPLQGLLTWIWWGIFASIFASSKYNIFWVAGALSWILLTFVLANWANWPGLLPYVAILSWILILMAYFFRITKYITLIPTTALHGFLIGVWISIAVGQLNSALWLALPASEKIYAWFWQTLMHIRDTNLYSFSLFLISFLFLLISKKKFPWFPSVIVLTIAWIWIGYLIKDWTIPWNIMLLSDKYRWMTFSPMLNIFSSIEISSFSDFMDIFRKVFSVSLIVAIIAILETIISAKIAEKITKSKYSREKEVFGLALSNIFSWIFGWLPVTAVFVRTAFNIESGAKSRYSAFLVWIFTLFISLLFFNKWFLFLPFPIIAAILINIAIGLIDIWHLRKLYNMQHFAFYVALITVFFYILEDPTFWIVVGTAVSLLAYLKRMTSGWAKISLFRNKKFMDKLDFAHYVHKEQKDWDIILLKFQDWLNYLNQENNIIHLEQIDKKIIVILSFNHMWDLDIDWVESINETFLALRNKWAEVYFSWLGSDFQKIISKTKIYKELHKDNKIIKSTSEALNKLLGDNYHSF